MAIDRAEARRRVKTITAWAAVGAAALTGGFAFGASHGSHAAAAPAASNATDPAAQTGVEPQVATPQSPDGSQGFAPPSASTAPPQGMSGGS